MKVTLKIWRQPYAEAGGEFERYEDVEIDEDASFLEMLDVLNDRLLEAGERPVAFDHDCREGICGLLLAPDRRHAPWPAAGDELPDLHARLRRRPGDHGRAVPRHRVPGAARPHGRPLATRPDHRVGRLRLGQRGAQARAQLDPGPPRDPGGSDGRRHLHRLRRLRRRLPERVGDAFHAAPRSPT